MDLLSLKRKALGHTFRNEDGDGEAGGSMSAGPTWGGMDPWGGSNNSFDSYLAEREDAAQVDANNQAPTYSGKPGEDQQAQSLSQQPTGLSNQSEVDHALAMLGFNQPMTPFSKANLLSEYGFTGLTGANPNNADQTIDHLMNVQSFDNVLQNSAPMQTMRTLSDLFASFVNPNPGTTTGALKNFGLNMLGYTPLGRAVSIGQNLANGNLMGATTSAFGPLAGSAVGLATGATPGQIGSNLGGYVGGYGGAMLGGKTAGQGGAMLGGTLGSTFGRTLGSQFGTSQFGKTNSGFGGLNGLPGALSGLFGGKRNGGY